MWFIWIYTVCKDEVEAKSIWKNLLERKLIACYNLFPIQSSYWWKWNLENDNEVVLLSKTRKENWNFLNIEIEKLHSYELPCVMKIDLDANEKYENWINEETICKL